MKKLIDKIAIGICIFLAVVFLMVIFSPKSFGQKSAKQYHQKLQKEYSFENRMKANQAFTLVSAKDNLRTAKKNARKANKNNQRLAKIRAKREQIATIKP